MADPQLECLATKMAGAYDKTRSKSEAMEMVDLAVDEYVSNDVLEAMWYAIDAYFDRTEK